MSHASFSHWTDEGYVRGKHLFLGLWSVYASARGMGDRRRLVWGEELAEDWAAFYVPYGPGLIASRTDPLTSKAGEA